MSQPNKKSKSKIFIIIFALVAIVVTGFMIWYTLIDNIDTVESSSDAFYISTEKTSEGLNTYDTYDENAIIIEEIEDGEYISYVQIDGLLNEEIENKINKEIEDWIYSYDTDEVALYSCEEVFANYANVLSITCDRYVIDEEYDYENVEFKTLNYDLKTGDQITFYDLFVSESAGLSIIRDSANIDLAEKYVDNSNVTYDEDDLGNRTLSMSTIDYGEIEEEVNYIVWCYRNNKIKNFYFNERYIYYTIEDETYSIHMADYLENIAIYNRYSNVLAEELYEDVSIARTGLYVLTYTGDYEYQIMEETENCYINLYTYEEDFSTKGMTLLKLKMEEMATEIKTLAESDGKFYIVNCRFQGSTDGEHLYIEELKDMAICEISDWSIIKDKLLEYWRQNETEFSVEAGDLSELSAPTEEDVWTYSYSEDTFLYDSSSGEEIIQTDEVLKEDVCQSIYDLVWVESSFETEEDENGNLEITNWWDYDNYIFTDNGFEIYAQNAIEQGYVKYEEVYITEDDEEEGYYDDKFYLTQQDEYQFGNMDLFLEDESTYEIEILEKSSSEITANVTVKFFKDEDCKDEYEQAEDTDELNLDDICDEVTIEIELKFIGYEWEDDGYTINWGINNYSIL